MSDKIKSASALHPLARYIRDSRIYNISQLEKAAGVKPGTLAKAITGERGLSELSEKKIRYVLEQCGVDMGKVL